MLKGLMLKGLMLKGLMLKGHMLKGLMLKGLILKGLAQWPMLKNLMLKGLMLKGLLLKGLMLKGLLFKRPTDGSYPLKAQMSVFLSELTFLFSQSVTPPPPPLHSPKLKNCRKNMISQVLYTPKQRKLEFFVLFLFSKTKIRI